MMGDNNNLIEKANELKKNEKFEESLEILEKLHKKYPNSEKVKKELIDTLFSYGGYLNDDYVLEYTKAKNNFKRIIEIDPNNYRALYNLGIAYFNLGNLSKAESAYEQAIKIKPDYKHCYYNIGLIHEVNENLKEALKFYKKALEIDPKFIYALQAKKYVKEKLNAQKRDIPDS